MATVAVTGADTAIGRLLAPRLQEGGHQVVAAEHPVRPAALAGADVVVHLLHAERPSHDAAAEAATDVEATRALLGALDTAAVGALVHVSSAIVYGAREDNPVPLDEDQPLRAGPEFGYAWHKRLADELVGDWARAHPDRRVAVLRPATVLGPGHDDFVSRHLDSPRLPLVRGHTPPLQVLHPDDLADAIVYAVEHDLHGPYNVAADGWLTAAEALAILGRKPLRVPESVAFSVARRLWATHLAVAPAGGLHYLMHPWVVETRRLREAGWNPRFGNREVLEAFAARHRRQISIGPVRTSRAAIATVGLGAAAVGVGLMRRMRRA